MVTLLWKIYFVGGKQFLNTDQGKYNFSVLFMVFNGLESHKILDQTLIDYKSVG